MMRFALGFLLFILPTCTREVVTNSNRVPSMVPANGLHLASIDRYESCDALRQDLQADLDLRLEYQWKASLYDFLNPRTYQKESSDGVVTSASSSAPASTDQVGTNLQVAGVDEADTVKMNSRYLFVAENQTFTQNLQISQLNKSPLSLIGTISVPNLRTAQLYVSEERLIVTGSRNGTFAILIYDIRQRPKLISDTQLEALPVASRMIGSKFFVVLQSSLLKKSLPPPTTMQLRRSFNAYRQSVALDDIYDLSHCTQTVKMGLPGSSSFIQRIVALDMAEGQIVDELYIPGWAGGLYMTSKNLYIYGPPAMREVWLNPGDTAAYQLYASLAQENADHLVVQKIGLDATQGLLSPKTAGTFAGHLKSYDAVWAFHEIEEGDETLLSLALSTGSLLDATRPAANHLLILRDSGKDLIEAAALHDFGRNEDIRSVRYVGNLAYIVTFKRTDPLFTIDLSQPLQPRIAGELKIPGFSLYLHPHGRERLLGVGYQTEDSQETDIDRVFFQGILFQLFDVKDPAAATRLFAVDLGQRGSYSDANQDHKAFYYDAANSLTAIPAVLFDDGKQDALNGQRYHRRLVFSGAIFYRITDQSLLEAKRVTHLPYLSQNCVGTMQPMPWTSPLPPAADVYRILRDGATIFAVSNFAVTGLDASTLAEQQTIVLKHTDCQPPVPVGGYE